MPSPSLPEFTSLAFYSDGLHRAVRADDLHRLSISQLHDIRTEAAFVASDHAQPEGRRRAARVIRDAAERILSTILAVRQARAEEAKTVRHLQHQSRSRRRNWLRNRELSKLLIERLGQADADGLYDEATRRAEAILEAEETDAAGQPSAAH